MVKLSVPGPKGPVFIPTGRGKNLLMYNGYTYSHVSGRLYLCSKRTRLNCKAKAKVDRKNLAVVELEECHNHGTRKFVVTNEGNYVPVN